MPEQASHQTTLLFTAFEPSGDAHAGPVIAELLRRNPEAKIYACGGEKMQKAGATMIEHTADQAVMGLDSVKRAYAVKQVTSRVKRWVRQYRVLAHVPVDSPAANFPICKITRKSGAKVIHLIAPQLWAWGGWRVRKMRRLTDHVLCLLPFEQKWFESRSIDATFVGHPAINREIDSEAFRQRQHNLPQGTPRVAIFPGSRAGEVSRNIGLLTNVYTELQNRHDGLGGLIVAANRELANIIRRRIKLFPGGLHMMVGEADAAIHWCDFALTVSGTITLDITRQQTPMIGVYKSDALSWLLSKVILRAPLRLLPNLVANREIVPEFVPYIGGAGPIVREAHSLVQDSRNAAVQSEELARVCRCFQGHDYANESAAKILEIVAGGYDNDQRRSSIRKQ